MNTSSSAKTFLAVAALLGQLGFNPLLMVPGSHAQSTCDGLNATHVLSDLNVGQSSSGSSVISWSFPTNVCLQGFVVSVTPLNTYGKVDGETTYFETRLQSTSIPELDYLRPYNFEVQVRVDDSRYGPKVSTIATPFDGCTKKGVPGPIDTFAIMNNEEGFNLKGDKATVCWKPPTEGACVEEYTLGRRMQARNDAEAFDDDFQWKFFTFGEAGCHEVGGHVAGRTYDYGIRGTTSVKKGNETKTVAGEVTALQAFLADEWLCLRGGTGYEPCSAGKNGQCTALDCEQIDKMGLCGAPFVRRYDTMRKVVVQYCSDQCSCSTPDDAELNKVEALERLADGTLIDEDFACCNRWGDE